LAFWRKPAALPTGEPAPEAAADLGSIEANSNAVEAPAPRVGRFARLRQALRGRRSPVPEQPVDLDHTGDAEPSAGEQAEANATADDVPTRELSLLARLKNKLRRQAEMPPEAAVDAEPEAEQRTEAVASGDVDSAGDENSLHLGRVRRVLAMLSSKWVWIPSLSVVLLALMGTMVLMLMQSAQENKHLQEALLATQKKLEQSTAKKAAVKRDDAPGKAGDPAVATAAYSGGDGDCTVTDKESVIRNLKNCIDSFNRSRDRHRL
jgi:hypothetical protein